MDSDSLQAWQTDPRNEEEGKREAVNFRGASYLKKLMHFLSRETKGAYALEVEARDGAPSARPNSGGQPNSGRELNSSEIILEDEIVLKNSMNIADILNET